MKKAISPGNYATLAAKILGIGTSARATELLGRDGMQALLQRLFHDDQRTAGGPVDGAIRELDTLSFCAVSLFWRQLPASQVKEELALQGH